MSDWLGNDGKMTSHGNFKLLFSEMPLNVVRRFLFQYGVI